MSAASTKPDLRYVASRRVLLDALEALEPHPQAVVVAGAQAIYLHTGAADIGIAPYTTDGDLAIDPTLLRDEPQLEASMRAAGFQPWLPTGDHPEPGIWVKSVSYSGEEFAVQIDLIVPEGFAAGGGQRGARLGPHGRKAARRVVGLEAALVDHSTHHVEALDASDSRAFEVEVAGVAALFVAKAHKIHDRVASGKPARVDDKDAVDVYRLMQTSSAPEVAKKLAELERHDIAGPVTVQAVEHLSDLFRDPRGRGTEMAIRGLRLAIPEDEVVAFATGYTHALLEKWSASRS